MTAIPASSVRLKTMADGSLQITMNVEPRHASAAFALFGMPGTPAALAALKVGTELPAEDSPEPAVETAKGWPLAKWAAIRGTDPRFQDWLCAYSPEDVAERIKRICGIKSRAELDRPGPAQDAFNAKIRQPWAVFCKQKGWTE